MARYSLISSPSFFSSSPISSRPSAVRRCRRRSRMARACSSDRRIVPPAVSLWRGSAISSTSGPMSLAGQSRAIICSRASAGLGALRISLIISSMLATATARPTNTWARSRALAAGAWCAGHHLLAEGGEGGDHVLEVELLGPAAVDAPACWRRTSVCRSEKRQSWFSTTSAMASRFSSMTMRMPSRLVSSQMSEMPSIRFSRTCSAIFSISVALVHLVGDGGDDQRLAILADLLGVHLGAHDDGAAALVVGGDDAGAAEDQAAGREVRARHDLGQLVDRDLGVVEVGDAGVDHLAQIVRRNVGRHADGDAARAVDQQVRELGRQDRSAPAARPS